jgi:hypothetical protein
MEPEYKWKNDRLGTELQIAGSFIFNALNVFDRMRNLCYEEECFEFLYNASIGIERLQKILIILLQKVEPDGQDDFEDSLITHNHVHLMDRINGLIQLKPHNPHVKFLSILSEFYKSTRYSRYRISSVLKVDQDKYALIKFIEEELKVVIDTNSLVPTRLDTQMKCFVSNIIGTIASQYYDAIVDEARKQNMYTYEMASDSKAYKIFLCKEYTFEKEHLLKSEIITFLLNLEKSDGLVRLIKALTPLPFQNNSTDDFVKTLVYNEIDRSMIDEMNYIYEENPFDKERFEAINILGKGYDFGDVGYEINS